MRRILFVGCFLVMGGLAMFMYKPAVTAQAEDAALKLFNSLTEEQRKEALLPWDSKLRYKEVFPPVVRKGLPFSELTEKQKGLVEKAIREVTSNYGTKKILKLAQQGKANRRYLTFFGIPGKGKKFAWRMAQHHLTLLYAEFGTKNPREFGPILLGGNPVKDLWDAEDQIFLKLYASLSDQERKQASSSGKGKKGIRIGDLSPKTQKLAEDLLQQRLAVFRPDYAKVFYMQLKRDGGVKSLRFAIRGDGSKSHHQGGKYTWEFIGTQVYCNWQTRGKEHIHMSLRARPAKKAG